MQNEQDKSAAAYEPKEKGKTPALASLLLAVSGLIFLGLTSIPAVIVGVVALIKMGKRKGLMLSRIFAVCGIIFGILIFNTMLNLFLDTQHHTAGNVCRSNVWNISRTAFIFADDHDGQLPPADIWQEIFMNEYDCDPKLFICPAADSDECTYAININIAGKNISEISKHSETVLFIEIEGGGKIYGGPEQLVTRHGPRKKPNSNFIIFADGHIELVKRDDFDKLRWKIEQEN